MDDEVTSILEEIKDGVFNENNNGQSSASVKKSTMIGLKYILKTNKKKKYSIEMKKNTC